MKKKKSIFSKLIRVNILTIIGTMLLVGTVLFGSITGYMTNNRKEIMKNNAEYLANIALVSMNSEYGITSSYYDRIITIAAKNANSTVLIVDNNGRVVASSEAGFKMAGDVRIDKELQNDVLLAKPFTKTVKSKLFKDEMLTVGMPISTNSQLYGAVLFFSPMPLLYIIRYDVIKMMVGTFVVASLVALLLAYIFSKKLTKPLNELNTMVKTITSGRFDKRVAVSTNDEIAELAENFNYMANYLENLEDVRSNFVANVSHELRTPMTTIGGFIDAILDGTIPKDKVEDYLVIIRNEINRLSRLTTDLLDASRANMLNEKLTFDEFDINELVRLTLIKFEQRIEGKALEVEVDIPEGRLSAHSNKDAMERVLTNLIDNAVKFANENGKIGLRVFEEGKMVGVTVMNTGSYIPPEEIKYVWDRFYKADKSRSNDKNGAGLGLYIVKNLVEACNGTIFVKSTKEHTEFTFKISK